MKVVKRDGREVEFDKQKIVEAIKKAMMATTNTYDEDTASKIANEISNNTKIKAVEEIQDLVENKLMSTKYKEVAKQYILYREKRNQEREKNSKIVKAIWKRIKASTVENSNANVDESSFSGREKEASSDVQKTIAIDYLMPKDVAKAHKEGLIYQHDLDKYNLGEHNCLQINFQRIFTQGFKTRNGDVRPPSSFSTACQLIAVVFQCQSQVQFGGVGSIHLDYDLAPFVKMSYYKHYKKGLKYAENIDKDLAREIYQECKKNRYCINDLFFSKYPKAKSYADDLMEEEGLQAAQGLYHNLNTLESRQGSQVPFTSINLGRDTSAEGRLVTKWIMQASLDGIGKFHLTSIFPISIFQWKTDCNANPEDPNYDLKQLALKSMSKRIYPNWVNCNWSQAHETPGEMDTYFSTMGCRTMIGYDRHGLGYSRVGRGNNVPITIILPKLGIDYGICLGNRETPDLDGFWKSFEKTLKLVEKGLVERFALMAEQTVKSAPFMYQNGTIEDADKCVNNVYNSLKHNTLAIGYIGIAEMCQALFGKNHVYDEKVLDFAISVVKRINEFAKEASDRNNLNFSCYATPAEGLCRTALVNLRNQYGIIPNVTDREYLTNSHHVPVWEKVSIYKKLEVESKFCKYPTGGCITYVELESTFVKNIKAIEDIIDYAFNILDIPYLAFNFPIDSCLDCGYQGEFNDECPMCHSKNIQQLRRVTGYLTADYHNFNEGKKKETEERVKHSAFTDFGK